MHVSQVNIQYLDCESFRDNDKASDEIAVTCVETYAVKWNDQQESCLAVSGHNPLSNPNCLYWQQAMTWASRIAMTGGRQETADGE